MMSTKPITLPTANSDYDDSETTDDGDAEDDIGINEPMTLYAAPLHYLHSTRRRAMTVRHHEMWRHSGSIYSRCLHFIFVRAPDCMVVVQGKLEEIKIRNEIKIKMNCVHTHTDMLHIEWPLKTYNIRVRAHGNRC